MRITGVLVFAAALSARAQDPSAIASIDEAFQLASVREMLNALPSRVTRDTTSAVSQFPKDLKEQFEPYIKDVARNFLEPPAFYRQLRGYFEKYYDAGKMNTFLVLERTPAYRTMHRPEALAETPAAEAARKRFAANLKSDPAEPGRVAILQRLDEATKTTDLRVRIVTGIISVMAENLAAQMPADVDPKSPSFAAKVRPALANDVLVDRIFVYRNTEDGDVEDCIAAARQPAVEWFNHTLQSALLAAANERAARAGEDIKAKAAQKAK